MKINIFKANDAIKWGKEAREKERIERMNKIFNKIRMSAALGKEVCTMPEILELSKEELKMIISNGYDVYFSFSTKRIFPTDNMFKIVYNPKICWGYGKKNLEEEDYYYSKNLEDKFLDKTFSKSDYCYVDEYEKKVYQNFKQMYDEIISELSTV